MTTELLSCAPGNGINEDLIRVFEGSGLTDILVLDGATSVADANYVDRRRGDVAWFVHAFADELERVARPDLDQAQAVAQAVEAVRHAWRRAAGDAAVPLYAWPLAAMTWVRIRAGGEQLALYCLGDCKALAVHADGAVIDLDPYVNPHEAVLQHTMGELAAQGVQDPAERRTRLLPMLRARREFQHTAAAPDVLCLAPQGPFRARARTLRLPSDSAVLAMTDGFYRLVDSYGLYTTGDLGRRCRRDGLAPLFKELRAFESACTAGATMSVKSADDASAVIWTAGPHYSSLKEDRS